MGRETKILLALLATLGGIFLGVLSMKLLVPRPPLGAGPDVHVEAASAAPLELVEPPSLSPPVPTTPFPRDVPARTATDGEGVATPPRVADSGPVQDAGDLPPPRRDPFVRAATLQEPIAAPIEPAEPREATTHDYVTHAGDSWWDLAARAYGDGRLYRALFAWNRVIDPRVSLTPGTRLEIPARERLEAAWPKLMPSE